jgi:hypothetical protein
MERWYILLQREPLIIHRNSLLKENELMVGLLREIEGEFWIYYIKMLAE